jgi:tetratricopeptide (TPR) repeat protein
VGREPEDETGEERSVEAGGSRSVAAGGDIGMVITGDNATVNSITGGTYNEPVIQARNIGNTSTGPQYTGDHFDFRGADFHDKVVAKETNYTETNYYGSVPAPADWRPVADVEPRQLGVSETLPIPGQPGIPPYVPRDCDEELEAKLAHGGLVLILGERYAGKSYTAWQGVRSLDGHVFYAPHHGEDLRDLLAALQGRTGKYVVWLDELTDHFGEGGLEPRLLGKLTGLGAVVLGTMNPDEYYRRRTRTAPGDRVVATARTVRLPREWTDAELRRLSQLDDPRAYPAYMWSGKEGAASYFAVGHLLFDEWQREGTRAEHPRGQMLVRAAVDLARCGVTGAVPVELLRQVQEQYGTEEQESFDDALVWATTSLFGVSGLLVRGEEADTWRAYGALVAEALRSDDLEPVPDGVWWLLLDAAEAGAPIDRGVVIDAARAALQPRFEAGDSELMLAFADHVDGKEREALLRVAAAAGHPRAAEAWAAQLLAAGDEVTALHYLEVAAERGSVSAAREAGRLHLGRAEKWLRTGAEANDPQATHLLGDLLLVNGDFDAAHNSYLSAEGSGYAAVARSSAMYHLLMSEPRKAEVWLRRAARAGDDTAALLLDALASDVDDTESYFMPGSAFPLDYAHYGALIEDQGNEEEAPGLYEKGCAAGDIYAAYQLASLLDKQGKPEEARGWYRMAADRGHHAAKEALDGTADSTATVDE